MLCISLGLLLSASRQLKVAAFTLTLLMHFILLTCLAYLTQNFKNLLSLKLSAIFIIQS